MRRLISLFILVVFAGCGPGSVEDYQEQGARFTHGLLRELKRLETREQLVEAQPRLRRLYEQIADVAIEAREFQLAHGQEIPEISANRRDLNEQLRRELVRVYRIPGGEELMEEAQREALNRLDAAVSIR